MKTAYQVDMDLLAWAGSGLLKSEVVVKLAEDCIGWSYVFGARGEYCTPNTRESYAKRSTCPEAEAKVIRGKCQVLNGKKGDCAGCQWYPGDKSRCFDCRGFTYWVLKQVGVTIEGAGATSQYNNNENWTEKGEIGRMPDVVCCVFMADGNKKSHTGLHVGGGMIIECSGIVKRNSTENKKWTHYAIPKGLEGIMPAIYPTIRRGDKGPYVTLAQTQLINKHYDVGAAGADGIFGKATEDAVKRFQKENGLKADGVVGPLTWDKLLSGEADLYTVIVPHLTLTQAEELQKVFPEAEKRKEG